MNRQVRAPLASTTIDRHCEEEIFKQAVREALLEHRRRGTSVAVWEDGKVRIVPPEEIVVPDEEEAAA